MGLILKHEKKRSLSSEEVIMLFERLVSSMEQIKKIKREQIQSDLLFEFYSMNRNNISKAFSESAAWIDPKATDSLLERGIIQPITTEEGEKYALTFKGIAHCIQAQYAKPLDEQFLRFLELSDSKFTAVDPTKFQWREKLASLSLILLGCTSATSAVLLTNESNKAVLSEVFTKVLSCLKKFGIVEEEAVLTTVSRGESPVSALMSRLDTLARKTNHYFQYIGKGSGYFFDIEKNGDIDEKRLSFLLERIIQYSDPGCNYREMYQKLAQISQLYSPRFLGRKTSSTVSFSILKKLDEFMDREVLRLPLRPPSTSESPKDESNS